MKYSYIPIASIFITESSSALVEVNGPLCWHPPDWHLTKFLTIADRSDTVYGNDYRCNNNWIIYNYTLLSLSGYIHLLQENVHDTFGTKRSIPKIDELHRLANKPEISMRNSVTQNRNYEIYLVKEIQYMGESISVFMLHRLNRTLSSFLTWVSAPGKQPRDS